MGQNVTLTAEQVQDLQDKLAKMEAVEELRLKNATAAAEVARLRAWYVSENGNPTCRAGFGSPIGKSVKAMIALVRECSINGIAFIKGSFDDFKFKDDTAKAAIRKYLVAVEKEINSSAVE